MPQTEGHPNADVAKPHLMNGSWQKWDPLQTVAIVDLEVWIPEGARDCHLHHDRVGLDATKLRPEMQNCLLVAQGELLRWHIYACMHVCVWIHVLGVIVPVKDFLNRKHLLGCGYLCGVFGVCYQVVVPTGPYPNELNCFFLSYTWMTCNCVNFLMHWLLTPRWVFPLQSWYIRYLGYIQCLRFTRYSVQLVRVHLSADCNSPKHYKVQYTTEMSCS